MAFLKIILMAAMPFVAMPLVSTKISTLHSGSSSLQSSANAQATENVIPNQSHGSTIYKTESDFPDFMKKSMELEIERPTFAPNYNANVNESRKYLEV